MDFTNVFFLTAEKMFPTEKRYKCSHILNNFNAIFCCLTRIQGHNQRGGAAQRSKPHTPHTKMGRRTNNGKGERGGRKGREGSGKETEKKKGKGRKMKRRERTTKEGKEEKKRKKRREKEQNARCAQGMRLHHYQPSKINRKKLREREK